MRDARLTFEPGNSAWQLALFAQNLTDKLYRQSMGAGWTTSSVPQSLTARPAPMASRGLSICAEERAASRLPAASGGAQCGFAL